MSSENASASVIVKLSAELMQNKLILFDNLIKLEDCRDKKSNIFLNVFAKRNPHVEFVAQKLVCQSNIESIKKSRDELSLAKYKIPRDEELKEFAENDRNNSISERIQLSAIIFKLHTVAQEIIEFVRKFDNLKSENIFPAGGPGIVEENARTLQTLFFSKSLKDSIIKNFDDFLLKLCCNMKDIIVKLDKINELYSLKDNEFDITFAKYYIDFLFRNMKKEKDFDKDVIIMKELHDKIFKTTEQLEKMRIKYGE